MVCWLPSPQIFANFWSDAVLAPSSPSNSLRPDMNTKPIYADSISPCFSGRWRKVSGLIFLIENRSHGQLWLAGVDSRWSIYEWSANWVSTKHHMEWLDVISRCHKMNFRANVCVCVRVCCVCVNCEHPSRDCAAVCRRDAFLCCCCPISVSFVYLLGANAYQWQHTYTSALRSWATVNCAPLSLFHLAHEIKPVI